MGGRGAKYGKKNSRNSFLGGIFCLEYPSRRNENRLRVVRHFSYNYRFSFRNLQNLQFANYRFSFRKLQIFISFRSISFRFVSQTTVSSADMQIFISCRRKTSSVVWNVIHSIIIQFSICLDKSMICNSVVMIFGINTTSDISKLFKRNFTSRWSSEIWANFEIARVVFMPNITSKLCYYLFILLPAKGFSNFHL